MYGQQVINNSKSSPAQHKVACLMWVWQLELELELWAWNPIHNSSPQNWDYIFAFLTNFNLTWHSKRWSISQVLQRVTNPKVSDAQLASLCEVDLISCVFVEKDKYFTFLAGVHFTIDHLPLFHNHLSCNHFQHSLRQVSLKWPENN